MILNLFLPPANPDNNYFEKGNGFNWSSLDSVDNASYLYERLHLQYRWRYRFRLEYGNENSFQFLELLLFLRSNHWLYFFFISMMMTWLFFQEHSICSNGHRAPFTINRTPGEFLNFKRNYTAKHFK